MCCALRKPIKRQRKMEDFFKNNESGKEAPTFNMMFIVFI